MPKRQYIEFAVDGSIINTEHLSKQQFIRTEFFVNKLQNYYGIWNKERKAKNGQAKEVEKINVPDFPRFPINGFFELFFAAIGIL